MTEEEKKVGRLLILEDALKQLEGYTFKAADGYLAMTSLSSNLEPGRYQLQELLKERRLLCYGCALGAMFLGYVAEHNNFTVDVLSDGYCDTKTLYRKHVVSHLSKYFNDAQLDMIEAAYEGWSDSAIEPRYVSAWAYQYPKQSDRLEAILKNCLRNDGTFNPRDGISEEVIKMMEEEMEEEEYEDDLCDVCGEELDDCWCDDDDDDDD